MCVNNYTQIDPSMHNPNASSMKAPPVLNDASSVKAQRHEARSIAIDKQKRDRQWPAALDKSKKRRVHSMESVKILVLVLWQAWALEETPDVLRHSIEIFMQSDG